MLAPADPERLITTAHAMLARGDADGAREMLRRALAGAPNHVPALRLLGLILAERGQHASARDCFARALAVTPDDAALLFDMGNAWLALDEPAQAASCLERAVAVRPDHVEALNNLGNALRALRRPVAALEAYVRALALRPQGPIIRRNIAEQLVALPRESWAVPERLVRDLLRDGASQAADVLCEIARAAAPDDVELLYLHGACRVIAGDIPAAVALLRAVVARAPGHASAWSELGTALLHADSPADALRALERAVALDPGQISAAINRGEALARLGRPLEALASYDAALAIDPASVIALNNRGNLLAGEGRMVEALADLDRAAAVAPNRADTHYNRGNVLQALQRDEAAVASYDRAVALAPGYAKALNNRGVSLRRLGQMDAAIASYRAALEADPGSAQAYVNWAISLFEDGDSVGARNLFERALALDPDLFQARCGLPGASLYLVRPGGDDLDAARADFAAKLDGFFAWAAAAGQGVAAVGEAYPFILAYHDRNNRAILARHGKMCADIMAHWCETAGLAVPLPPAPAVGAPIRIGIVMSQFWNHSVWLAIVKGWVAHLDRRRFEVHLFHTGPRIDAETEWARAHATSFTQGVPPQALDLAGWVGAIQGCRPDVLIYPEFGMDHLTMRLASMRLARVQAASWGHPETTGLPTIDHYITSEAFEPPDAGSHYTENLVRLPRLGCSYARLPVSAAPVDLAALGVDGSRPILLSPGTPFKYQPESDRLFIALARRLPDCQLVFFSFRGGPGLSRRLMDRLAARFAAEGLDFSHHVRLLPWLARPEFYGLLQRGDVMLDTVGFSGFNTVMQALECTLPVAAFEGRFLRGRLGSGILRTMGMDELVATDIDSQVEIATRLATDTAFNAIARARIAERREALFDDVETVRVLEDFLERAVRQPG